MSRERGPAQQECPSQVRSSLTLAERALPLSNRVGGHRGEWRGRERDSREMVSLRSQCSCPCPPPLLPNMSPLPNVPIHFLAEDERLVGVVLDAGGCHVADLKVGGKTLIVVLSDVVVCCAWWSH